MQPDAFGVEKSVVVTDTNPFRYCGEYYDLNSGTYYLRARYYDPATSRMLFEDPSRHGLNYYTYCYNNPVMYADPSGNIPILIPIIIGIGIVIGLTGCSSEEKTYFTFSNNLKYSTKNWNAKEYQSYTNCYAYAFNMLVNPLTGKKFQEGGMQPGMLSGKINYDENTITNKDIKNIKLYLSGTIEGNKYLVDLVIADMNTVGLDFVPYKEGMTGGYKVALVVNPGNDYHWYRQDADGTWSHKQGQMPVTQDVGYYVDKNNKLQYNSTKLSDPKKDAATIGYTSFVGYYYVKLSDE